jgi:bacillithiol system protein YtxJ
MNWRVLNSEEQLDQIREESKESPILIFKHSTRCSISRTVLDRLERNWNMNEMNHVKTYFLDLISYRLVSNGVADRFEVQHESPQVLIIQKGKATMAKTHLAIDYASIRDALKN